MTNIVLQKINESFCKVITDDETIGQELYQYFRFLVPNAYFMIKKIPKLKNWDGYKSLFDRRTNKIYLGLLPHIKEFCADRGYELDSSRVEPKSIDRKIEELSLPEKFEMRDYQISSIQHLLDKSRGIVESATSSGKSLTIYGCIRLLEKPTLLIVPTVNLVSQMYNDFAEYSSEDPDWDIEQKVQTIYEGQPKYITKEVVISTWQSLQKLPKSWFEGFQFVLFDEVHKAKADVPAKIMEQCVNAKYRLGTTGTIQKAKIHSLVLEGLFGERFLAIKSHEMQERGLSSQLAIRCVVLNYPESITSKTKKLDYSQEIEFLFKYNKRTKIIAGLALQQKLNTLVLFSRIEHGEKIFETIKEKAGDRSVYFISGHTEADEREEIRTSVEKDKNAIIVASLGVYSTGVNIKNLYHVIFAAPIKSEITVLQSIGRALRIGEHSNTAYLWDIADNLSHGKHKNFAIKHFLERTEIYNKEKFRFTFNEVSL